MSELDRYIGVHPEMPHIEAMRLHLLAQLALKQAQRDGTASFEADGVEVNINLKEVRDE